MVVVLRGVLPLALAVLWEIATWIIWACGWVGSVLQAGAVWATATVLPLARAVLWEIATWIIWACGWVGSVLQAGAVWATATVLPLFCEIATWIGSNALSLGIAIIQFYVRAWAWAWIGSKIGAFGALMALLVLVYIHLRVARRVLGLVRCIGPPANPLSPPQPFEPLGPPIASSPTPFEASSFEGRYKGGGGKGNRRYGDGTVVGYHATNASAARSIRANGFQCGRIGLAGGGIYFATSEQDASRKSNNGRDVVFKCQVTLGRTLTLDNDGNSTMTLDKLNGMGYDSVKILRNGDEYVVYEPSRVRVLSERKRKLS